MSLSLSLPCVVAAIQYLVEVGKVLYFNDQLECLNSIYFLKPVYLQELLNLVLADRVSGGLLFNDALNTFCLWLYGVRHNYGEGPLR